MKKIRILIIVLLSITNLNVLVSQNKSKGYCDTCTGVYEYTHPNNVRENNYIYLKNVNDVIEGYYYGTSDEFDEAREGYLLGFFVAKLKNIEFAGDTIRFVLDVNNDDIFTQPIKVGVKSTKEVTNNTHWDNFIPMVPKKYQGVFLSPSTIYFRGEQDYLDKKFHKRPNDAPKAQGKS